MTSWAQFILFHWNPLCQLTPTSEDTRSPHCPSAFPVSCFSVLCEAPLHMGIHGNQQLCITAHTAVLTAAVRASLWTVLFSPAEFSSSRTQAAGCGEFELGRLQELEMPPSQDRTSIGLPQTGSFISVPSCSVPLLPNILNKVLLQMLRKRLHHTTLKNGKSILHELPGELVAA